jgi:cytochrome c oxidase cbb3-type subunit III
LVPERCKDASVPGARGIVKNNSLYRLGGRLARFLDHGQIVGRAGLGLCERLSRLDSERRLRLKRLNQLNRATWLVCEMDFYKCSPRCLLLFLFVSMATVTGISGTSLGRSRPLRKQDTAPDSSSGIGRQTFDAICASCHGLDGRGGERGPDIATRPEVLRLSDRDTLQILREGIPSGGMPAFASLGRAKLSALLEHLRALQGKGSAAAIPGDPQKGQSLFFGTARCSECHMVHGEGGFLSTDLSAYGGNLAPSEIRSAISNRAGSSEPRTLVTATLRDGQVIEGIVRNEDNFSLQLQSVDGAFHLLKKSDIAKVEPHAKPLMPADYGSTLTPAQLDDLVGYLMTVARQTKSQSSATPEREDD